MPDLIWSFKRSAISRILLGSFASTRAERMRTPLISLAEEIRSFVFPEAILTWRD